MELNPNNKAQVSRYVAFFKGKRERALVDRDTEKQEFVMDRLADDEAIFNKTDVEDMIEAYHAVMVGSTRETLEEFINLSAVHFAQGLAIAESAGLAMEGSDVASIDQLGPSTLAGMVSAGHAPMGAAPARAAGPLPSLPVDAVSPQKVQELEEANRQMRERYQAMQVQVSQLLQERSVMQADLERAAAGAAVAPPPAAPVAERFSDSQQFKELKNILKKKTDEVKNLRQFVVASGLELPNTSGGIELTADD